MSPATAANSPPPSETTRAAAAAVWDGVADALPDALPDTDFEADAEGDAVPEICVTLAMDSLLLPVCAALVDVAIDAEPDSVAWADSLETSPATVKIKLAVSSDPYVVVLAPGKLASEPPALSTHTAL
jgi:hypothetical protein